MANWLDDYRGRNGDLYHDAAPALAAKWRALAAGLAALGGGEGSAQDQVARQIGDLGLTFRIAGDEAERPWPLTAMPLVVSGAEWAGVERGLVQRARLLEAVAADIYGPGRLVADGHLPPAVVTGSRYFARKMLGVTPPSGHYLHVYAADLARGPDGEWRVLGDRLRLANGIGYALENRMAMSRVADRLLSDLHARRLADFFASLRDGIAADCARERPRVALLTPGRFNQSYSEQAHLARYLGVPLVEGRDLVVDEGRLYVRTIAGPKRIDAAWRWIDTTALDPLNFDSRSRIGVPGLFDALSGRAGSGSIGTGSTRTSAGRGGGVTLANWPGIEVLEAPALSAFLPRLAGVLLGEPLVLPNLATWWCGQPAEAAQVAARLDELVVVPAFDQPSSDLAIGADGDRDALRAAMRRRPMDYCGQQPLARATTPALIGERLVPRGFTIRAFVARVPGGGWTVMPGGFARLSAAGEPSAALMGEGDLSADVCIVDDAPPPPTPTLVVDEVPRIWRGSSILASQAADNLFWFARYNERAEVTVRIVRSILGSSIEVDGSHAREPQTRASLIGLLRSWGASPDTLASGDIVGACAAALVDGDLPGSVAALLRQAEQVGLTLRERLAPDFWRLVRRPLPPLDRPPGGAQPRALLDATLPLLEHFAALSGLVAENMVRGLAWRFLDIGRRIERAVALVRIARRLTGLDDRADALGVLLDLADSQIAYRARYLTGPLRDPVLDLVLLDPDNPRALLFQVRRLVEHVAALNGLAENTVPEPPLIAARAALAPLESHAVAGLDDAALSEVETRLLALSDAISTRYFLQFERADVPLRESLLG